jgi:sugar phosphate permease
MTTFFYGWWIVIACFSIALYVGGVLVYGFTAFFEPIVAEFGWSHTQVSVAFSLRGLEMGILAPLIGFLVDRYGSQKLVFSGALTVGSALILLSLTDSLFMFYGAFILLALGASGCASTVLMAAVAPWFRRNVGKAMGLVACGFGAGGILIPVIVWLIDVYGWRTSLVILGLVMWGVGIPLSFLIRHRPEQYGYFPDGEMSADVRSDKQGQDIDEEVCFGEALRSRSFWLIGIAETIRIMVALAVITHVMPYLTSMGMPRASAGLIATSIPLLSIIGRLGFGWLGDVFEKRYVLAVVYCIFGLGTFAFSYIHEKWFILLFLLLFSPALGGGVSLRSAIVREYFGRMAFGRLFGVITGMAAIGGVIGPSFAGWTFDSLGSYRPVWIVFAGTVTIAMVLALRLESPVLRRQRQENGQR